MKHFALRGLVGRHSGWMLAAVLMFVAATLADAIPQLPQQMHAAAIPAVTDPWLQAGGHDLGELADLDF